MSRHRTRTAAATVFAAALVLSACSSDTEGGPSGHDDAQEDQTEDGPSTADPGATAEPDGSDSTATAAPTGGGPVIDGVEFPDVPEAEHAEWLLAYLQPDAPRLDQNEVVQRVHPDFLAEISGADLEDTLVDVREMGTVTVDWAEIQPTAGGDQLFVGLEIAGAPWAMQVGVTDGQISTLWFGPNDPQEVPDLESWDEVETALVDEMAQVGENGQVTVFVAEVTADGCVPEYVTDGAEPAPSGSTFKLAVLSAVVDAVESGDLAWDEDLTVTDDVKSLPSGVLQDEDEGTTVTVEEAASLMIAISDNTATDMLIDQVGADAVEQVYAELGMDTDRVTPLITTKELFELGWGAPEVLEDWAGADSDERRALLDGLSGDLDAIRVPEVMSTVVWPEQVEYFFTAEELCATHARLQEQAATEDGEPVREILSLSTLVEQPDGADYLGFKGGSSTGAEAIAYYAETEADAEGEGRVLIIQVADPEAPLPEGGRYGIYQAAVNLLVAED